MTSFSDQEEREEPASQSEIVIEAEVIFCFVFSPLSFREFDSKTVLGDSKKGIYTFIQKDILGDFKGLQILRDSFWRR